MIRQWVENETGFPEDVTLRSAVEWYKKMSRLEGTTQNERDYIDGRWVALVAQLADQHEVPVAWLSWALSALAEQELRLMSTATEEGTAALAEGGRKNLEGS